MNWQAADDGQGDEPGQDKGLPELLAAFAGGGAWGSAAPSAALATALERAAGPRGLFDGADTDALVGIARQWAAVESWAAAGLLGALRAMMREDSAGAPVLRRRTDLPAGWDDSLNYEVAAALAMGPVSAQHLAELGWALGTRLPGIGRLLADGTLTKAKARLIAQLFEPLDETEAARAEALIVGELKGKTYPQVDRLAWRAVLAVAPDVAERRRVAAEGRARVTVFREEGGTAALSGRDLPAAEALAGHANVLARARLYAASGVFPGESPSSLGALAFLDLLGGIPAADRIAFAATATGDPPEDPGPDDDDGPSGGDDPGPGPGPGDGGGMPEPDDDSDEDWPGSDCDPAPDPDPDGDGRYRSDDEDDIPEPGDADDSGDSGDSGPDGSGPDDSGDGGAPGGDEGGPGEPEAAGAPVPLAEVTVPLATLQGKAERAGDSRLLGPIDPALARHLAAAAARSPHSRWEIIVTDENGYATGHGIARPARGAPGSPGARGAKPPPQPPPRPSTIELPARITITITQTRLRQLAQAAQDTRGARAAPPRSGAPPGQTATRTPHPGTPPGNWDLRPKKPGTWALRLPGARPMTVRFDVVPTHECDHRYQTSAYQPGDRLRRLVQVRDHQCTFPTCSRPAAESDFEHALPYDKGGKTDACNAGARSRRCHQVKQSPGWTVTQPRPGWHQWTTPTGRSYVQEPWQYTA